MVQTFKNLSLNADLNSSTLTKLVKSKVPQDLLLKRTEYIGRNDIQDTDVQHLQIWLEVQAKTYDKLHNQFPSFNYAEPSKFSSNSLAPCCSNVTSNNPQASKTIGPESFNQYRTQRKQCSSSKNEHNITVQFFSATSTLQHRKTTWTLCQLLKPSSPPNYLCLKQPLLWVQRISSHKPLRPLQV